MSHSLTNVVRWLDIPQAVAALWGGSIGSKVDEDKLTVYLQCPLHHLQELCAYLFSTLGYSFATLVVEEGSSEWLLRYVFYGGLGGGQVHVISRSPLSEIRIPSISPQIHAADWQEREVEDLFGLVFEGHPRLGDFVLHEEWPEGVNPMRKSFDASKPYSHKELDPKWQPEPSLKPVVLL